MEVSPHGEGPREAPAQHSNSRGRQILADNSKVPPAGGCHQQDLDSSPGGNPEKWCCSEGTRAQGAISASGLPKFEAGAKPFFLCVFSPLGLLLLLPPPAREAVASLTYADCGADKAG